uniref:Nonstructural protein n=1 Tax=Luscinia cyane Chaphamaparvovirus TaxID=2794491 RepID=A0A8A4XC92_9VIRU|nr:MAG: nonstructural protein [Luscinia cyane Chaphamaparvovirus]
MASKHPENSRGLKRAGSPSLRTSLAEVQCATFPGIRCRRTTDGLWVQPEGLELLGKQEKESLIDHYAMANWICGVIVIKHAGDGHVADDIRATHTSKPFVDILDSKQLADSFVVAGEISDNGVHHTHFLLRTNSRTDSVRRSLLNNQHKSGYIFDVCKLAVCRYWFGMFCYILKNPLMVFCSDLSLAKLAYTCIEEGNTIKYIKQGPIIEQGKDVVQVINKIIQEHNCKTTDDVFTKGGDKLVKYLHLTGLQSVMTNCLSYVHSRNKHWDPKSFKYAPDNDPRLIHNILERQGIYPDQFDPFFWKWICRENGKLNTLIFIGPSNTGKSVFIRGLCNLVNAGSIVNTSSPFFAEGICGANIGLWEEPLLTAENAEAFKLISEGAPMQIPQKFKKPFNHPGCPILITTNHNICRFCSSEETTIMNRCKVYLFSHGLSSSGGCGLESCLITSRAERRSTPCYLNWGTGDRDSSRVSAHGSTGYSGPGSCEISRCGRWWCRSNGNGFCSYCSRSKIKRTNTGGSSFSTSTSISGNYGSSWTDPTRSTGERIFTRPTESLLRPAEQSGQSSESPDNRNRRAGCGDDERLGSGRTGADADGRRGPDLECSEILSGWEWTDADQSETAEPSPEGGGVCTCITEPLPQDWQAYLCYLANKYE